ncbi:MAG: hypothetical protein DRJ96_02940 [Thermoprotei archaeon]|nr:MAG: hypothetical protein DRJ67_07065 [Thermoprotei archaeon]RLE97786.1 MAG: hypothetical protein DRJ96_02940 [Thermoprotei archaeon]
MHRLIVVKLGGSLITDKQRPLSLRREALASVSREMAEICESRRLVIVHGGGSFGHFAVLRAAGSRSKLVEEVRYWMTQLNLEVVRTLRERGVPAVGLPPIALAVLDGEGLCRVDAELVSWLLEAGLVPVTHGGLVRAEAGGLEIVSGDTLASELAVRLGAEALIYLMDVDGVYTSDPRAGEGARLLKVVTPRSLDTIRGSSSGMDVTGGIRLKLMEALRAARSGVRVALGGVRELRAMVEGVEGRYTIVKP